MLITFLWFTGLRITEALSITKKNIDFTNYMITAKWLKSRKYKERVIPIHPRIRELLLLYTATMNLEDSLFPFSRQYAWKLTKKYLGGSPHKLRHSFAVNWLRNDGDIVTLHRILGHSKIQTTMEYLKIVPIDQAKELNKISFD
jgi:integrase/recombinase XerD